MPCDSITTQSINLSNAIGSILADALKADGWNIETKTETEIVARFSWQTVTWKKGGGLTVKGNRNEKTIQRITQAYSGRAVTWAAQRAGWTVNATSANTMTVTRR